MPTLDAIENLIIQELEEGGDCTLDRLAYHLRTCSWNQIFMAVDALSRRGTITLRPEARFEYLVSLVPSVSQTFRHLTPVRASEGAVQTGCSSLGR